MFTIGSFKVAAPGEAVQGGGNIIRLVPRPSRFAADGSMRPALPYGYGDANEHEQFISLFTPAVKGKRVADVGAGAGILSIAAALHGAKVTAYEGDALARETLKANLAANGLTAVVDVRGDVLDEWTGELADIAVANLGNEVPAMALATDIYVTDVDPTGGKHGMAKMTANHLTQRPVLAKRVRPAPLAYPKRLHEAHAKLTGVRRKRVTDEQWEGWEAMTNQIRIVGQRVLALHPEDEEGVAMLVARGNLRKLERHDWLREVAAATGEPWWNVTVNEMQPDCGCVHEHWFKDGHHDGSADEAKIVRWHENHEMCSHHVAAVGAANGKAAWMRVHEEADIIGDVQRYDPSSVAKREGGVVSITAGAEAHGRSLVVHGTPNWLRRI